MTPKLYRAGEVCELVQVQPYVLRSWEKEFPGIGVQKGVDGPRLYNEADLEAVNRIKHLVFVEGLTVAGARRKLESAGVVAAVPAPAPRPVAVPAPEAPAVEAAPVAEAVAEAAQKAPRSLLDGIGPEARVKVAAVRETLQSLQAMLAAKPGEKQGSAPPALMRPRRKAPVDAQPEMFATFVEDAIVDGESGEALDAAPAKKTKAADGSRRRRATA